MELYRRTFLRLCGVAAGSLPLPCCVTAAASTGSLSSSNHQAMLSDLTKCIGCGWCQEACREWNHLSGQVGSSSNDQELCCLSADTWTLPELHQVEIDGKLLRVFVKRQCMHCVDPACVSACPVGALQKLENGAVTYDCERCIGCRYCMVACPFGVPKFEWDQPLPRIQKCTFCADRQAMGVQPACAAACPTGALLFGDRDQLIAEAERRIQSEPGKYVPHVYGQEELGGTSWLYLSPVPFEALGFPALQPEPVTSLSEAVATYGTVGIAASVTFLLGGMRYWFAGRGNSMQLEQTPSKQDGETQS